MLNLKMLQDLLKSACSAASGAGVSRCDSQDGRANDQSGPAVAHVSRSQQQDAGPASTIPATSGPICSASSESAALQLCLENKLAQLLGTDGSIEYAVTWKQKVTPAQRQYCQLVASARRTSDKDCSGVQSWLTPKTPTGGAAPNSPMRDNGGQFHKLEDVVRLMPWVTLPASQWAGTDAARNGREQAANLDSQVHLITPWASPIQADAQKQKPFHDAAQPALAYQVHLITPWASPTARDFKDGACNLENVPVNHLLGREVILAPGPTQEQCTVETESTAGYQLNPEFTRWLQGYPPCWSDDGVPVCCADTVIA